MNIAILDKRILDTIIDFVVSHSDPAIQKFQEGVTNWGSECCRVERAHIPAADYLTPALKSTNTQTHWLLVLFEQNRAHLRWEQSYKKEDRLVGNDMLAGYGYSEIVGKHGPFISTIGILSVWCIYEFLASGLM